MNIWELCEKIGLQIEIISKLKEIADDKLINEQCFLIERLTCPETAECSYEQLSKNIGDDKDNMKLMYCYLKAALLAYRKYQESGIPDEIYFETMKGFTRFAGEYHELTGEFSFTKGAWIWRHISMCLFRIGQLEYEFTSYRGEKVVSIHIPSDANFSREAVQESISQAKVFIQKYFPDRARDRFLCYSWIMSPKLKSLLDSNSNIINFQDRFELVETEDMDTVEIPRIFKMPYDTPYDKLKEETSLQRKVKELLLSGNGIGRGYGFLKLVQE